MVTLTELELGAIEISTVLPETNKLQVRIVDQLGGESFATLEVEVRYGDRDNLYSEFVLSLDLAAEKVQDDPVSALGGLAPWAEAVLDLAETLSEEEYADICDRMLKIVKDAIDLDQTDQKILARQFVNSKTLQILDALPSSEQ
jgi:hypothetical protein